MKKGNKNDEATEKGGGSMNYKKELAWQLIEHFSFAPGDEPPTFSGFRQKAGLSLADFRRFAARRDFAAAIEEAKERYRETLAAGALMKRYDPTFVRHLLFEGEKEEKTGTQAPLPFSVEIRVVE